MPSSESSPLPHRFSGFYSWIAVAIVLAVYAWTLASTNPTDYGVPGGRSAHYYNLLVDGFLKGQLSLEVVPAPGLLASSDPYDPTKRPNEVLHDAAFYQGRYYVYFGAAPAVMLFLPWRLLTHADLSAKAAVFVFTFGGFLLAVALLRWLVGRYFPTAKPLTVGLAVLLLGLGDASYSVLRRPSIWEVTIAGGYFFVMAALACLPGIFRGKSPAAWMAGAGLFLALAVGSRPTYLVAAIMFPIVLWTLTQRKDPRIGVSVWRAAIAGAVPFAGVMILLGWYNYARFGNPLEFGLKYNLTGSDESKISHFGLSYFLTNLRVYLFSLPQFGRYFPYVHPIRDFGYPPNYLGVENTVGLIASVPPVLFALFAFLGWRRRPVEQNRELAGIIGAVLSAAFLTGAVMCCFRSSVVRYEMDFVPEALVISCVGIFAVDTWFAGGRLWRTVLVILCGWSVALSLLLNLQLYQFYRDQRPREYRIVSRIADAPVLAWERTTGTSHGPVEMDVLFPVLQKPEWEPLVNTGWAAETDFVAIYYCPDMAHVQIAFDHTGTGLLMTDPISVDFKKPHRIRVDLGSLHAPSHRGTPGSPAPVPFSVTLDGAVVLTGSKPFYPASPESTRVGYSPAGPYGRSFTGRILAVRRN